MFRIHGIDRFYLVTRETAYLGLRPGVLLVLGLGGLGSPAGDRNAVLLKGPLVLQGTVFPFPRLVDVELLMFF